MVLKLLLLKSSSLYHGHFLVRARGGTEIGTLPDFSGGIRQGRGKGRGKERGGKYHKSQQGNDNDDNDDNGNNFPNGHTYCLYNPLPAQTNHGPPSPRRRASGQHRRGRKSARNLPRLTRSATRLAASFPV